MIDSLRWLVGLEVCGFIFLPLTFITLGRLRDGGYPFSKVLSLLLVTYVSWLAGSFAPVARAFVLPALAAATGLIGWWLWRENAAQRLRRMWRIFAAEEAIFVVAFAGWALLRVYVFGAAANHTEQFMDMALLNATYHAASYPAYDPWMSAHSINYYYFGYLLWATFTKLVGVAPVVAFNLANVSIVALVVSCTYSVGYSLTASRLWAAVAPLLIAVVGNLHAALWGIWHGLCGQQSGLFFYTYFWPSSRVIGSNYTLGNWTCAVSPGTNPPAIDEYPLFSFILGDLHPHVMALPLVLLVVALAMSYLFGSGSRLIRADSAGIARLVLAGVVAGSLFVTNSWDFPTYFLVLVGAIAMRAYAEDTVTTWWRTATLAAVALAVVSVALYIPFYVHFHTLSSGIGPVTTPTDLFEFIQMFGVSLAGGVLLVGSLSMLLQPEPERVETFDTASEAGEVHTSAADRLLMLGAVGAVLIAAAATHRLTLACLLGLGISALVLAYRVLNTEEPNRADAAALLLVAVGCLAAAIPEVVYLRDVFAGGPSYRMNTIFKFYYQAWVLLGLAAAYGAWRSWTIFRAIAPPAWRWSALALLSVTTVGAGIYTAWIPFANVTATSPSTLDASAWLATSDPGDARAIAWLRKRAQTENVILEAVGDDYQTNGTLISTFTGLPTVMGWAGHENQWRPNDADVQSRVNDVKTIYTTQSIGLARQLLGKYSVKYVLIGEAETAKYGAGSPGLRKFRAFMRVAYSTSGATIYTL